MVRPTFPGRSGTLSPDPGLRQKIDAPAWRAGGAGRRDVGEKTAIVASAAGRTITLADLHRRLKRAGRIDLVRAAAVEAVIDAAIAERGVHVSDAALQRAADAFRADRRLFQAEDTHAWLAAQGFAVDDFEAGLERELQIAELRRLIAPDAAVERRFAELRAQFSRARVSVLETETEAQAEEARAQIEEEEADFAELASRLSKDEDLRGAGGYVGWIGGAEMDEAIRPLVLSAAPGAIVGPARSGAGWALIKVWAVAPPQLNDTVAAEIRGALFDEWVDAALRDARVESPLIAANDG